MSDLNVLELLRQQAARRQQERNKIHDVASTPVDPEVPRSIGDEENGGPLKTAAINIPIQQQQQQKSTTDNSNNDNNINNYSPTKSDRATNTFPSLASEQEEQEQDEETRRRKQGDVLISPARRVAVGVSPSRDRSSVCRSPTEDTVSHAQLKSRISILENETESLRAVVDLARKENAALRDLILKMAKKTMGDDWKMDLGIDLSLGTALAGMGQPAAELTFTQRQRLIELLDGKNPNLLP